MTMMDKKTALRTISLIASAGKKLDERIHTVAVAGLQHFFMHGDSDILSQLQHAMPKSGRGNALKFWITQHAPLKWDTKSHAGKGGWKKNGEVPEDWAIIVDAAEQAPFYEQVDKEPAQFKPEQYAKTVASKLAKEGMTIDEFIAMLKA